MGRTSQVDLPAETRSAGRARAHVRETLTAWGLDAFTDTVVLLVSELVTNALLHASSGCDLRLEREGTGVRVTVSDRSPVLPSQRRRSSSATTGRGCQLLEDLADSWGAEPRDGGKDVWFVVSGDRDPWLAWGADALLDAEP